VDLNYYLAGLPNFLFYLAVGTISLVVVMFVYKLVTPHREVALVKEGNTAAAIAIAGVMIGLSLPIASASLNSVNLYDFALWALIGGLVQILAFFISSFLIGKLSNRITTGEISAGIYSAGFAIAFGILNAASMVP
jgi:putative membrane protein